MKTSQKSTTPPILVSACLAGINCRYDGSSVPDPEIIALVKAGQAIPVCPELLAGFAVPRPSAEIVTTSDQIKVVESDGHDVTQQFHDGAAKALALAREYGCHRAILKSKSPSCGYGLIYDGTFTGGKKKGHGVFAGKLLDAGIVIESRG